MRKQIWPILTPSPYSMSSQASVDAWLGVWSAFWRREKELEAVRLWLEEESTISARKKKTLAAVEANGL
jgi:hypothetical protein